MSFHVGQRVVCVDDTWPPNTNINPPDHLLVKGHIYTVASLGYGISGPGINLLEINRYPSVFHQRVIPYNAYRFRPLDTLTETMDRLEKEGCPQEVILEELCCN